MNMLLKVLSFVCLVSCAMALPALSACPETGGGFVNDPSGCAKYFSCVDKVQFPLTCPTPLQFNIADSSCSTKEIANCKVCPATGISRVADETACDKYILCVNGIETSKSCDLGDHFNVTSQDCDTPSAAACPIDPCLGSTAEAPYVVDISVSDCTKYIVCIDKKKVDSKTCNVGLFFDVAQQRCSSKFKCT